jgi:mono/diheme cytochrome c family protein
MSKLSRSLFLVAGFCTAGAVVLTISIRSAKAQPAPVAEAAKAPPPTGQTYVGVKECSACHFKQYMAWKKTKHSKESFEILPEKYRADAQCIVCHTTGAGQPSGYKDATTPNLIGVTCEACHGPGSKHAETAKQYSNKKLSADEEKIVRGTIWLQLPQNVCVSCHVDKAHKDHPRYSKE